MRCFIYDTAIVFFLTKGNNIFWLEKVSNLLSFLFQNKKNQKMILCVWFSHSITPLPFRFPHSLFESWKRSEIRRSTLFCVLSWLLPALYSSSLTAVYNLRLARLTYLGGVRQEVDLHVVHTAAQQQVNLEIIFFKKQTKTIIFWHY